MLSPLPPLFMVVITCLNPRIECRRLRGSWFVELRYYSIMATQGIRLENGGGEKTNDSSHSDAIAGGFFG